VKNLAIFQILHSAGGSPVQNDKTGKKLQLNSFRTKDYDEVVKIFVM
jgi:hypothetical protein